MKLQLKLKKFREEKDMTQDALAKKLGVSISAIAEAEVGKRKLSKRTALRLAEFSNYPVEYWIDEDMEYYDIREDFKLTRDAIANLKAKGHIRNGECDQMARQFLIKALEMDILFLEAKGMDKK